MQRCLLMVLPVVVGVVAWNWPLTASHAQMVNPSAPPPGGQTAVPLNTGSQVQEKLGSLIIGQSRSGTVCDLSDPDNNCAQLCLNGIGASNCLKSWSDLAAAINSSYVRLNTTEFSFLSDADAVTQTGYINIRGTSALTKPNTVTLSVNDNGTNPLGLAYTALYADAGQLGNFAAVFAGTLAVEPASGGARGTLCLNGTGSPPLPNTATDGHYCISNWSDIPVLSTLTNKLTRQIPTPANPLAVETSNAGNVGLPGGFGAGAVVLGDPNGLSCVAGACVTCGDGMCGTNENATTCAIDCAAILPATSITAAGGADALVTVTAPVQTGMARRALVVRSDTPNNAFTPVNGVTYTVGTTSNFAVVFSSTINISASQNQFSFFDRNLIDGQSYTYTVYLANLYPRYSTPISASFVPDVTLIHIRAGVTPSQAGSLLIGDEDGASFFECSTNSCDGWLPSGTRVVISLEVIDPSYRYSGLTVNMGGVKVCDIFRPVQTCPVFTLTAEADVAARFVQGGGDDGGGGRRGD